MSNLSFFLRFVAILLGVSIADGLYVWFAAKPLPGAAVISALVPLLVSVFIIIPMQRLRKASTDEQS
jgi:hypothetical protein